MNTSGEPATEQDKARFVRLDALLDDLLDLPDADREDAIPRLADGDGELALALHAAWRAMQGDDALLDRPATELLDDAAAADVLAVTPGTRIGPYSIVELIGRGGMGEVHRARRTEGGFEQEVAIKLLRPGTGAQSWRFQSERQILARLAHPNIARLLDGGIASGGLAWMAMELVDGAPIDRWCDARACGVPERVALFAKVCDAVAFAHRNLVVHRDIKPANVLVRDDGEPMLLDFGIAHALDGGHAERTQSLPLTLNYAAPEQLTGGAVTTATDVHALGVLLFELLVGHPPWRLDALPLAAALQRIMTAQAPAPSRACAESRRAALRGDLDAIVARCLRKTPEQRYATVAELRQDLDRHARREPVAARAGARWYTFGRVAWRYRLGLGIAALVLVLSTAAVVAFAWQAQRADLSARRATAIKEFLVSFFRATDPRIASDKPRGQITARELMDVNADRIDKEFAADPELQLELLAMVSDIYGYLEENARYEHFMKQRLALALRLHGPLDPTVIDGVITDAWAAIDPQKYGDALRLLDDADHRLAQAGLDDSASRAEWWLARGEAMKTQPNAEAARREAYLNSVALFEKVDPGNASRVAALANLASLNYRAADYEQAEALETRALAAAASAHDRSDEDVAVILANRGLANAALGRFDQALKDDEDSAALALRTTGAHTGTSWLARSRRAFLLCQRGDDAAARALFDAVRADIPPDWKAMTGDSLALELDARCLTMQGRAAEAVDLLQRVERVQRERPREADDLRRARVALGTALAAVGRRAEADAALTAAVADYAAAEPPDRPGALAARLALASLLLDEAAVDAADAAAKQDAADRLLAMVVAAQERRGRWLAEPALAMAQQGRLALQRGQRDEAMRLFTRAASAFDAVQGAKDVRAVQGIGRWRDRAGSQSSPGAPVSRPPNA